MQGETVTRNPLRHGGRVFHLPDFPAIRPEHVMPALEELLQAYREGVERKIAVSISPRHTVEGAGRASFSSVSIAPLAEGPAL